MLALLKKHPIKIGTAVLLLGIAGLGVLWFLYQWLGLDTEMVLAWVDQMIEFARKTNPGVFVAIVTICPLIGFPVTPFLLAAAPIYGKVMGMVWAMTGLSISTVVGYWIGGYGFRDRVESLILKRMGKMPSIPREHTKRVIIMFRMTPGFPLFIQNYILGFVRVPFFEFCWLSFLLLLIQATGYVIFGGAIFEGSIGLAVLGLSLLIVVAIASKLLHSHLKKQK